MEKKNSSDIHKDHRKRVRARFIQDGNLDSFQYHQILELLLFYAVPRKDTNELAHNLLNEYGSFHELLNAKPEELMKRCNLTEPAAVLLSIIPHISRKYLNSTWDMNKSSSFSSFSTASEYLNSILAGKPYESFYMLCLDAHKRLKKCVKISDGNSNSSPIYIDNVLSSALLYKASFVIIGHNHPGGTLKPSSNDVAVTRKIRDTLKPFAIRVLDHIIVCGEENYSFAVNGLLKLGYDGEYDDEEVENKASEDTEE